MNPLHTFPLCLLLPVAVFLSACYSSSGQSVNAGLESADSTAKCPAIIPRHHEHSSVYTVHFIGQNITMSQNFTVYGPTDGLQFKWERYPYDLTDPDHYYTNISIVELDNTTSIVTVSLTIPSIDITDEGYYTVTLSNDCTSNHTKFRLRIPKCPSSIPPKVDKPFPSFVVAQPRHGALFCLSAAFTGNNDRSEFAVLWKDESGIVCSDSYSWKEGYSCSRDDQDFGCTMVVRLCIANLTTRQLSVHSHPVNYGVPDGNSSVINLTVALLPYLQKVKQTYYTSISDRTVSFEIHNYSPYVRVCAYSGESTVGCPRAKPQWPLKTRANVDLYVDKSTKEDLNICLDFTNEVNTSLSDFTIQCTQTRVSPENYQRDVGLIGGLGGGGTLLLLSVAIVLGVVACWHRRKRKSRGDYEVLGMGQGNDDDERDCSARGQRNPRARENRRVPFTQEGPLQVHVLPVYSWICKLSILYAHNPRAEGYTQVRGDGVTLQEMWEHDAELQNDIRDNKLAVRKLAMFLQQYAIEVVYDQQLGDSNVSNSLRWLEAHMDNSDFLILVVTPSLLLFLRENPPPEANEVIFRILHSVINSDRFENRILPVFLDRPKDVDLLPQRLAFAAHTFEVHKDYFETDLTGQDGEPSDLQKLYQLITSQEAVERTRSLEVYRRASNGGVFLTERALASICEVSSFSQDYQTIAGRLGGVSPRQLEECQRSEPEETCYQMLRKWRDSVGHEQATVSRFMDAVRGAVDREVYCRLAEKLEQTSTT